MLPEPEKLRRWKLQADPASRHTHHGATVAPAVGGPKNGAPDRDALLQTLFPNGIPAKESVIRSVNAWLDEAERLAGLR